MLREALHKTGYQVAEASDGLEAIRLLTTSRFKLVLTDLKLPKKDGLAVLKAAKEVDPLCPVIVMTAFGDMATALQTLK